MNIVNEIKHGKRILEVEGLRAVAVVAVIVNHFFEGFFPSGFLGVDVFFVISGYVITKSITESAHLNWKSFILDFFARRVKRLYPALWVCVLVTALSFLFLTSRPSVDVFRAGAMALLGSSNIFLHVISSDYFSLDSKLNPFTHTWSLGVEEQFYLLFPFILGLAGYVNFICRAVKRRYTFVLPVILFASLGVWFVLGFKSSSAQFYLLPSRMWQLCLGAICFLYPLPRFREFIGRRRLADFIFFLLFGVFFLPQSSQLYGTFFASILTFIYLNGLSSRERSSKLLASGAMVWIGGLSYSLYLWHWSFLVLGRWTFGEATLAKIIYLLMAIVFSLGSFYFVERPVRSLKIKSASLVIGFSVSVAFLTSWLIAFNFPQQSISYNNKLSEAFGVAPVPEWDIIDCHGRERTSKLADPLAYCLGAKRDALKPSVIYLIGDSHSAQLFWMLKMMVDETPFQLKFVNLDEDMPMDLFKPGGKSKTLDFVLNNGQAKDLLLVAFHRGHLNESRDRHIPLGDTIRPNDKMYNFIENFGEYAERFNVLGVKVIFVRDTPLMNAVSTSPACALQIKAFGESICRVGLDQDLHTRQRQDIAFSEIQNRFSNVASWDPLPFIYKGNSVVDVIDTEGHYIMWDWNHITRYQSEKLSVDFASFLESVTK